MTNLNVHSIFESISGEAGFFQQGGWCTFVRLQGCNLRCSWCDTLQAQEYEGGKMMSVRDVAEQCKTNKVLITGGEPLVQEEGLRELISLLQRQGKQVQVETNGSFEIPEWGGRSCGWIVDYKCLSSGYGTPDFGESNLAFEKGYRGALITNKTMVKFVVKATEDIEQAKDVMIELIGAGYKGYFIISPADADKTGICPSINTFQKRFPALLDTIIFSLQLHKIMEMD